MSTRSIMKPIKRILVAVDFSESARAALEQALSLAQGLHASVDVVHAWEAPIFAGADTVVMGGTAPLDSAGYEIARRAAAEALEQWVEPLDARGFPDARGFLLEGTPAEVIVERAPKYDLIVMGTHGRSGLSRLVLGSVSETVMRKSPVPVLCVRAPESGAGVSPPA